MQLERLQVAYMTAYKVNVDKESILYIMSLVHATSLHVDIVSNYCEIMRTSVNAYAVLNCELYVHCREVTVPSTLASQPGCEATSSSNHDNNALPATR